MTSREDIQLSRHSRRPAASCHEEGFTLEGGLANLQDSCLKSFRLRRTKADESLWRCEQRIEQVGLWGSKRTNLGTRPN